MQVVATFENGERVKVERYEQNQKVGTRRLYFNDYVEALMGELPIAEIVHQIVARESDYQEYMNSLQKTQEFTTFFVQTMKYAELFKINDNENFQLFIKHALEKVDVNELHPNEIERLFTALINKMEELPSEAVYLDLLDELLKRVISVDSRKDVIAKVFPSLVQMARELESPLLREWFELAIPHIDPLWLVGALGKLQDAAEMKIAEMDIPTNCVLTQITTKRHIYVLEIPKSRFRVKFHNVAYEDVGHPRMACILHVQGNKLTKMKLVAVPDEGQITFNTPVYHYPYSNVFDDGSVCWNGYYNESIESAKDLSTMPLLFLSGANNTHLRNNVRELFDAYQGKDFPAEQLRPFGRSLRQVIS